MLTIIFQEEINHCIYLGNDLNKAFELYKEFNGKGTLHVLFDSIDVKNDWESLIYDKMRAILNH